MARRFEDGDPVFALGSLGRWLRDAVVGGSQVLVLAHNFQARGIGILKILHDPHAAASVENEVDGLANQGLTCGKRKFKSGGGLERFQSFVRGEAGAKRSGGEERG